MPATQGFSPRAITTADAQATHVPDGAGRIAENTQCRATSECIVLHNFQLLDSRDGSVVKFLSCRGREWSRTRRKWTWITNLISAINLTISLTKLPLSPKSMASRSQPRMPFFSPKARRGQHAMLLHWLSSAQLPHKPRNSQRDRREIFLWANSQSPARCEAAASSRGRSSGDFQIIRVDVIEVVLTAVCHSTTRCRRISLMVGACNQPSAAVDPMRG